MAVHALRKQTTKKRRLCASCGTYIEKGTAYWSRNSSMWDREGRRVYGFFSTHPECEEIVREMGIGLGKTKKWMSFPGGWPGSIQDVSQIPNWDTIEDSIQRRFKRVVGTKKKEPHLEYRYYDPETKQRSAFKATLKMVEGLVTDQEM